MDNKHVAVWNWLLNCPYIADLYFNFSQSNNNDTVLIPETAYNDEPVKEYNDGSSERKYIFTVVQFQKFSTVSNSTENIETILDIENIAAWVDGQNEIRNFPEFPGDAVINEIKVLPFANGGLAAVNDDTAKYMFSIEIDYLFEKGLN